MCPSESMYRSRLSGAVVAMGSSLELALVSHRERTGIGLQCATRSSSMLPGSTGSQELQHVRDCLRVLQEEDVPTVVEAQLGVRDALGDGFGVLGRRDAVVPTGG